MKVRLPSTFSCHSGEIRNPGADKYQPAWIPELRFVLSEMTAKEICTYLRIHP